MKYPLQLLISTLHPNVGYTYTHLDYHVKFHVVVKFVKSYLSFLRNKLVELKQPCFEKQQQVCCRHSNLVVSFGKSWKNLHCFAFL